MILLDLQLTTQYDQPYPTQTPLPFLGGIFHGAFKHLMRHHEPSNTQALGMFRNSSLKYYAILPPPYEWQPLKSTATPTLIKN